MAVKCRLAGSATQPAGFGRLPGGGALRGEGQAGSLTAMDWDDAFDNSGHVPGSGAFAGHWQRRAAAFRDGLGPRAETGIGVAGGAWLDLFHPEETAHGVAVFIHGGYWKAFAPDLFSHLAAGALAAGLVVAMPGYPLAPAARIGDITRALAGALEAVAARFAGPIHLAGHSAGGHLAARLLCADAPLSPGTAGRIAGALSISGVHDLRPLLNTRMNALLRLDRAAAAAESPALLAPREGSGLTVAVGLDERPEFLRQARLLVAAWAGLGARTRLLELPETHHFDIIEGLESPDTPLTTALLAPGG